MVCTCGHEVQEHDDKPVDVPEGMHRIVDTTCLVTDCECRRFEPRDEVDGQGSLLEPPEPEVRSVTTATMGHA